MAGVSSPCIGVCALGERGTLCLGCGRTVDEIVAWGTLSEPQRRAVMAALPARLATRPAGRADAEPSPALDADADHPQLT